MSSVWCAEHACTRPSPIYEERLKQSQKWISVKERLPKIGDKVLVISRLGDQSVATFDGDAFVDHHGIGAVIKYFTHWMPLPEPPEKEASGQ